MKKLVLIILISQIFFINPLFSLSRKEIRLLYKSGTEALRNRKYDEAILYYKNILNSGSNLPEARNNLAFAYMKTGKTEEAIKELHKSLDENPEYADAMNNLAICYLRKKGFEKNALPFAKRATIIEKSNSYYHDTLGQCYQALKLYDKAKEEYNVASALNHKNPTPILHLGNLLFETKEIDEAILTFRRVLDVEPENIEANWNLYNFYIKEKNLNSAKFRLEKLFKSLSKETDNPALMKEIEKTLICNFKTYLTELAVIISRTENKTGKNKDFFINYGKINETIIADLIPVKSLFCPTCGKFYTSFINHVICPVHGYSEILTENLQDIREMRKRYNRQICLRCRYGLAFALAAYRLETGKELPDDFNDLLKEGYLQDIPKCPNGGIYELDDKGLIKCDKHGEFEELN